MSWISRPCGCGIHCGLGRMRPGRLCSLEHHQAHPRDPLPTLISAGCSAGLCYTTLGWLLTPRDSGYWGSGLAQEGHRVHPHRDVPPDFWPPQSRSNPWGFYKGSLLLALTGAFLLPWVPWFVWAKKARLKGDHRSFCRSWGVCMGSKIRGCS